MPSREEEIDLAWSQHRGDKLTMKAEAEVEDLVPRSEWLSRRLEEQDGRCKYCERRIDEQHPDIDFRATTDHVVPRRHGGADVYANVVAVCEPCNDIKGRQPLEEFLSDPKFRIRLNETRLSGL